MKLTWGRYALEDRRAIFSYLEGHNPSAAVDMDEMIQGAVQNLRTYPNMGRQGRVANTRELVVVAYAVIADRVKLLRVLHGAQQWPESMPEL